MEVTSVTDVSKVLLFEGLGTGNGSNVNGKAEQDMDFRSYLDMQTNSGNTAPDVKKNATETPSTDVHKAKLDRGRKDIKSADSDSGTTDKTDTKGASEKTASEDIDQDIPEEVVAEAVTSLIKTIAEVFNMDTSEVETVMSELDIEPVDLLDSEGLQKLLLDLTGMEDTLELITDENALDQFSTVIGAREELLNSVVNPSEQPEEMGVVEVVDERTAVTPAKIAKSTEANPVADTKSELETEEKQDVTSELTLEGDGVIGSVQNADDTSAENEEDLTKDSSENSTRDLSGGTEKTKTQKTDETEVATRNVTAFERLIDNVEAGTKATATESAHVWNQETENIMNQIMEHMRINLKDNETTLEMQLHPASLGTVQIQLSMKGDAVTATFTTQNETVKNALQTQLVQLLENFDKQGVKVDAIEVTVQTHQFEQNLSQGNRNSNGQDNGNGSNRRRHFRGIEELNAIEGVATESLTSEGVMEINGSTVEFKA